MSAAEHALMEDSAFTELSWLLLTDGFVSDLECAQARLLGKRSSEAARVLLLLMLAWQRRGHTAATNADLLGLLADYPVFAAQVAPWQSLWSTMAEPWLRDSSAADGDMALLIRQRESTTVRWGFQKFWRAERRIQQLLERYGQDTWNAENSSPLLSQELLSHAETTALAVGFSKGMQPHAQQIAALRLAMQTAFCIVAGGPGSGKTTVVKTIVAGVCTAYGLASDRVVLCAPTGRAKARLEESFLRGLSATSPFAHLPAKTLHSLLRYRPDGSPSYHQGNPLPYDLVVVDEASMVDSAQFAALLGALSPSARLLLVGDPDQLPSVDGGAVLADLLQRFPAHVARLTSNHRTAAPIMEWWSKLPVPLWNLHSEGSGQNREYRYELARFQDELRQWVAALRGQWQVVRGLLVAGNSAEALGACARMLESGRILCATHQGPAGRVAFNRLCRSLWQGAIGSGGFRDGELLLVGQNQSVDGIPLYNGDLGVAWVHGRKTTGVFYSGGALRQVELSRLAEVDSAFAITVHKSQGSEFDQVFFALPTHDKREVSRQLAYTAVTRARYQLVVLDEGNVLEQPLPLEVRRTWLSATECADAGAECL